VAQKIFLELANAPSWRICKTDIVVKKFITIDLSN
jgi:hypothetical protein